jgi:predicted DNA-binding WGR domain protein
MAISILHRIDQDRNMARAYELSVQPGLFGDVSVLRHWGRIGTIGQSKEYWFRDETEAAKEATAILRQKQKRGYILREPAGDVLVDI